MKQSTTRTDYTYGEKGSFGRVLGGDLCMLSTHSCIYIKVGSVAIELQYPVSVMLGVSKYLCPAHGILYLQARLNTCRSVSNRTA